MGAKVARMFRNYNIENRALREISKEKPRAAPRHATGPPPNSVGPEVVKQKNQPLLDHLRTVYVESRDPAETPQEVRVSTVSERRPTRFSFPVNTSGVTELTDVPTGKLTLVEALRALGNHQHQPQTWTPQKISQEYSLDLKEVTAVLRFFIPFHVEITHPKGRAAKRIKG
ncbi:NADH dehydrogenase [ubiquinone] 1 alpha subcomplex assembly factor 4 [Austrofundulus limnaeus]|uniref:NADH dehydrogenase [ubiquinone] 1 alpha subcomplex assembly factor 4 n=1 Tax=Austrofundulus limnaeus TaxID=52670 RepID=A0A2I4CQU5_AUSLI|nr:PREDICTED: NADH dehydrogenase [ubiquinone] 1 alpha subcomplex assembly factor 4 [Austrofundulus limnaeus]